MPLRLQAPRRRPAVAAGIGAVGRRVRGPALLASTRPPRARGAQGVEEAPPGRLAAPFQRQHLVRKLVDRNNFV